MPVIEDKETIAGQEVTILIDVDEVPPETPEYDYGPTRTGGVERVLKTTSEMFGSALQLIRNCSVQVVEGINKMEQAIRPEEIEVQLAIRLDGQIGVAVLAKASAGAQMQVKLKWSLK